MPAMSFLKIKSPLILVIVLAVTIQVQAQTKNRIGMVYGFASNSYYYAPPLMGDVHITGKGSTQFGINYFRKMNNSFSIETGLVYVTDKVQFISYATGVDGPPRVYTTKVLSVPVYGNLTFAKYLFINGGLTVNFDISKTKSSSIGSIDNQSGIGFGMGLGGKYTMKSFTISVNPFLKTGPIIPFSENGSQGRLAQT